MTATVKTRGIWVGGVNAAGFKNPQPRVKVCSGEIDFVYFDLIAAENASCKYAVYVDNMTTPITEATVQCKLYQRDGKAMVCSFEYPAAAKTAGVHKIRIKTGTASKYLWTSPDFEVVVGQQVEVTP